MKKFYLSLKDKKAVYLLAIGVGIIFITYGYYCGLHKVCKSEIAEKVVREGMKLELPKGVIYAEVVDTPSSRAKGLSGRSALDRDEGMLFVFDHPGKYGFWMKDMHFSIDMVWINEEGVVVHVERNVSPDTYTQDPPQTFINQPEALYVLELASGQADAYGLYLGTNVIFHE